MRLARKGPSYQAGNQHHRRLRAQGIPTRYWRVTADAIKPLGQRTFSIEVPQPWARNGDSRYVSAQRQRAALEELLTTQRLRSSYVLGIGSTPTDELAMSLATALLDHARNQQLKVRCISVQRPPGDSDTFDHDVVLLHNLVADCHVVRAQYVRDWLDCLDDCFRIAVVAGQDPYGFFHGRLHHPLDAGIYLCGERRENP